MSGKRTAFAMCAVAAAAVLVVLWFFGSERGAREAAMPASAVVPASGATLVEPALVPSAAESEPQRKVASAARSSLEVKAAPDSAPKRAMHVLVLRADEDQPLADAHVTASDDDEHVECETGADGRCELSVALSDEPMRLRVEKAGFFHVNAFCERQEELTIRLAPTVTLFGQVRASDTGGALAGVRIGLVHGYCKGCEPDVVVSADDGSYELAGVPRLERVTLVLTADGFPEQFRGFETRDEGSRVEVDLALERGLEISGRVIDFESAVGLSGAHVGSGATDSNGAFRTHVLPELGAATVGVEITAAEHCKLRAELSVDAVTTPLEFRLPRSAIVEGVVHDDQGQPAAGVRVSLGADDRARERTQASGVQSEATPLDEIAKGWSYEDADYYLAADTDDQGRFHIDGAVPWQAFWSLYAESKAFGDAHASIERMRGPGGVVWVELELHRRAPEQHVGGSVSLNGSSLRTCTGRLSWKGPTQSGEERIETDEFHCSVEAGTLAFHLTLDDVQWPLEGADFTLQVPEGARIDHRIELTTPTRPITGRVVFADGAPVPGSSLEASAPLEGVGTSYRDRLHFSSKTAREGTFVLDVPDDDRLWRVETELDQAEAALDGVRAGASGVGLVLARSGVLEFRIRDAASGAFLSADDFELVWKPVGASDSRELYMGWPLEPDPDGWYRQPLPVGPTDLSVSSQFQAGYLPFRVEGALISLGAPLKMEFVMKRGIELELRLDSDAPLLPKDHDVVFVEEQLWARIQHDPATSSWETGGAGSAFIGRFLRFDDTRAKTIRGLAPGRFRFKVFPDDLVIEPAEVLVDDKTNASVVVRWHAAR